MPTVTDVIKRRLKGTKGHVAVHIWCREDIIQTAKRMGVRLGEKAADEILDDIDAHLDSELGITWDTIYCAVNGWMEDHPRYRRCGPEEEDD